ncbi:MAG: helix-turn-helix transcriptional regulator [Ruminococcus sp.]|nr:helix-turn-helix transcriptional regulator [Ruminococcus sp.]MCM1380327.1 helix-turn-helix transcriptional regulator [Muribaculaceae bacterium]MCM1478239.1 helix-turn-helix transcriptional regulator [Muribaculaceae bacterium]
MNIKELRKKASLTQQELGEACGKTKTYISELENGVRNIKTISAETLIKIADALGTTAEAILTTPECGELTAEWDKVFDDGKDSDYLLVIDQLAYDSRYNQFIVCINDKWYRMVNKNGQFDKNRPLDEQLMLIKAHVNPSSRAVFGFDYLRFGCVPRGGFDVKLGREITKTELNEIIKKYNLGEDDISGEFADRKGGIYGKYAVTYTAIQVRTKKSSEALDLESELWEKGIEAGNIADCRVNIRIK